MIVFHCPNCERSVTLQEDSLAVMRCPHCSAEVEIPTFDPNATLPDFPALASEPLADAESRK